MNKLDKLPEGVLYFHGEPCEWKVLPLHMAVLEHEEGKFAYIEAPKLSSLEDFGSWVDRLPQPGTFCGCDSLFPMWIVDLSYVRKAGSKKLVRLTLPQGFLVQAPTDDQSNVVLDKRS